MTATQTATTELNKINYINHSIDRKLGRAETARQEAIAKISDGNMTMCFDIEKLIRAEAELHVWRLISRIIDNNTENNRSEEDTLNNLIAYLAKSAISEHKINSTSNISVEQETEQRLEWARAYNFIAGIAEQSY